MNAPRPDDLLQLDLSAASRQYAAIPAPADAVWPRATVRFVDGWWYAKVWQSPGEAARRQSLMLAGKFQDQDKAVGYARYEVGLLRFTRKARAVASSGTVSFAELDADWKAAHPAPKVEPPC